MHEAPLADLAEEHFQHRDNDLLEAWLSAYRTVIERHGLSTEVDKEFRANIVKGE